MDPIIYLIGALMLSLAIIYYGAGLRQDKKMPLDIYKDSYLDKMQKQIIVLEENATRDYNYCREIENRLIETENKLNEEIAILKQKIETAEFMAHSAKMDAAKPLKILHYHYSREVPPKEQNEARRKQYADLKKQMEQL